jgi:hypothetical protein
LEQGGHPHCKCLGRGHVTSRIFPVHRQKSRAPGFQVPPWGRKGGSAPLLCALLLSFPAIGWEPNTKPEQKDLYAAPPCMRAPGPCFLFIPCCWDSMGRNCPPAPLWRHKRPFSTGAPETLHCGGGEAKTAHKEWIVCWGPGSEQGPDGVDRSRQETT